MNEGLYRKLSLIFALAGFGKTMLVSEWIAFCERPVAWLSLDEADNDPAYFLSYLVAALQVLTLSEVEGIAPEFGQGVLALLQSPQPPPPESTLTTLLNEITAIPDGLIIVFDHYHVIDAQQVDNALTYLLMHLPPQIHLVIATRDDPQLPLARLRACGQMTELCAADLRFTSSEAAEFLNQVMGLDLSSQDISELEVRTLGWIAGLQLVARPTLWVTYATTLLTSGQIIGIEENLQAAEAALQGAELDDKTRDLIGRIADTRGTMAVGQRQVETIITQSRRALEYLNPDNLTYRTSTTWKLGVAYKFQGDRAAAGQVYTEAMSISQASGNIYTKLLTIVGLGNIQLAENQLYLAADTYQRVLQLVGDLPIPVACHVHLCLARICYEWNDLQAAQEHGQKSLLLANRKQCILWAGNFQPVSKFPSNSINYPAN